MAMRWFRRKTDKRSNLETPVHEKSEHAPVGAAAYVAQRHAESGAATHTAPASHVPAPASHASAPASHVPAPASHAPAPHHGDEPQPVTPSAVPSQTVGPHDSEAVAATSRETAPPALMTPDQLALVPSHARDGLMTEMDPKRRAIVDVLRSIYDPEIPVNIYDIGLIYDIQMRTEGKVGITMTLTSPMCPVAETLPPEVQNKVSGVDGVFDVDIGLVLA